MFLTEDGKIQSEAPQIYMVEPKNRKHRNRRNKRKRSIFRKVIKAFFITFLIMFIIISIASGYIVYQIYNIAKDAKISVEDLVVKNENSVIKDMQGNTLGVLNGNENRESIPLR